MQQTHVKPDDVLLIGKSWTPVTWEPRPCRRVKVREKCGRHAKICRNRVGSNSSNSKVPFCGSATGILMSVTEVKHVLVRAWKTRRWVESPEGDDVGRRHVRSLESGINTYSRGC
jgi:hypothetical protein